jgi:hypothetical protein
MATRQSLPNISRSGPNSSSARSIYSGVKKLWLTAAQSKHESEREPGPEDFDRIEGEFRIEAALNVAGLPEAMLLAREQEIADRIAPPV